MTPFSSIILRKSDRLREGFRMEMGATGQVTVELGQEEGGILVNGRGSIGNAASSEKILYLKV